MKHIGQTTEGNFLVEINHNEYAELQSLCAAVEGRSGIPFILPGDRRFAFEESFDFTKTFQVIKAWYIARMMINGIRGHLDDIQKALENV